MADPTPRARLATHRQDLVFAQKIFRGRPRPVHRFAVLPAQPGLGLVIAKTLAPVIPMRIFGAHEAFPRGQKKIRFHPVTVVVGEPMHFTEADLHDKGRDLYQRLSEQVMARIAELQNPR